MPGSSHYTSSRASLSYSCRMANLTPRDSTPGRSATPGMGGGAGGRRPPTPGAVYSGKRRPRWGRIALICSLALLLLAGLGLGGAWIYVDRLDAGIDRTDPFSAITGDRPAKEVDEALNILILGSDSRDPDSDEEAGSWRTDTLILLHVPASHDKAYLISIPRDLYVYVPQSSTNADYGDKKAKINASFAWGGLPLVVETIETYTGVLIDNVMLIDFSGFEQVTDALGGVDMYIEQDITSIHSPYRTFTEGTMHLDGAAALDYVRQRYQFAEGDFARMRHQQEFMKALMEQAVSSGTLTDLSKLNDFLQAVADSMTVDEDFSLTDMAMEFRNIRSDDLIFTVSPHLGSQTVNGESVVMPDEEAATALYEAVKEDKVASILAQTASPSAT